MRQVDLASRQIRLEAGTTKNGEGRIAPMTDEAFTLLTACVIGNPLRVMTQNWGQMSVMAMLRQLTPSAVGRLVFNRCAATYPKEKKRTVNPSGSKILGGLW